METRLPSIPQRIVIAALAVVMVVGLAPTQAFAASSASQDEAQQATQTEQAQGEDIQASSDEAGTDASAEGVDAAIETVLKADATAVAEAVVAEDEAEAADDIVVPEGKVKVELTGVHSAQIKYFKLYTYTDGVKGETNLLDGIDPVDDTVVGGNTKEYVVALEPGNYWVEGYSTTTSDEVTTELLNGGLEIVVTDAQAQKFKVQRVYGIYASNSGWVESVDYSLSIKVTGQDGTDRHSTLGQADNCGTVRASSLFLGGESTYSGGKGGDTVEVTFTPIGDKAADYVATTVRKSLNNTASNFQASASIPKAITITVNAPAGSTISVGNMASYYVYTWFDGTVTKDDETGVTETFRIPASMSSGYRFYRVQNPNGVTYWNYASNWSSDTTIDVTADDLKIGSADFTKDTVYRFEKNIYDRADIYLNINAQGYKNMQVGETFELNVFRNWMAIESFFNSKVALPDMHYTVVDTEGNPSDVVSIVPDANNSSVAKMTANKQGTAIVMVTYDAMTHVQGQTSTKGNTGFSAIWPECTGMFIVNVGADGSSIQTNMQIDRVDSAATSIDAEHDILFYLGDEGASYSFTPEKGTTVTVDRSVVTDQMTFKGFTSEGVTTNAETGEVTVSGLTTGRHIIKVEKNGVANYQVVTARQTSYELLDSEGNEISDPATQVKAGDTVKLQFSNLVMPCEKMSGIYNMNASLYYKGADGTTFRSNPGSSFGVYDFSGNPVRQLISITIPKYWDGDSYTLSGAIKMGGFITKNPGGHRGVTYADGTGANYNAPEANSVLASLPDVSISLAKTDFITGTFNFVDEAGNKIDPSAIDKVEMTDSDGNVVNVNADGTFNAFAEKLSYTVYANGYRYTTGELELAEDAANVFDVKLVKTSDDAWDGQSTSQPAQDADGVYQISTGAELAWINEQSNLSKGAISNFAMELVNDIDMADYPMATAINGSNGIQVEGNGHTVLGLNAAKGFIDVAGSGSNIANLRTEGTINSSSILIGGIVNSFNGAQISNCTSGVAVTGTGNSTYGGIVAQINSGATVTKCVFDGSVDAASAGYVGGIVGRMNAACKIVNCYSTGDVTGNSYVGGLAGQTYAGSSITACYCTGDVAGTHNVGGFVGAAQTTTLSNCYSMGTVTGGSQFAGTATSSTFENCYAPAGDGLSDSYAELLSTYDLKNADLANWYFAPTCGGYPALLWQTNVTFHEAGGDGITVAANCLNKGYTSYACKHCYGIFKTDYTEATGHTAGEDMKVYPTHCEYTCTVCGTKVTEYGDSTLAGLTFSDSGVSNISTETVGNYPWTGTSTGMESTCQGVNSGESNTYLKFTLDFGGSISFDYGVSSESRYDKLYIILYKPDGTSAYACDGISGSTTGSYSIDDLAAGSYKLRLYYVKDSSGNTGSDKGWIENFKATGKTEAEGIAAVQDTINKIDATVTLESEAGIVAARAAYDGLPASAQAKVDNYDTLLKAEAALAELKAPEADKTAIANVVSAINAIGTPVTLDKASKVESARAAYNALTDAQKTSVTNYQTLVEAEAEIASLNQNAADNVAKQIYSIGKVRAGVSDEAIANARKAYDGLTDYQKTLVGNYSVLTDAEAALDAAYAKQVYDKIDAIGDVTADSKDAIEAARAAYDALTDAQKEQVSNYSVLTSAEDQLYDLTVPVFTTTELSNGYIGEAYSATVEAQGTPAPTITVTGLPAGLTFDAETGTISGTPTKVGTYEVEAVAANGVDSVSCTFAMTVYNKSEVRVAGQGRVDTMAQILDKSVADGSQSDIILTTAWNYADALSASGLVGVYGSALVTTDGDSLSYAAKQEIQRISDGSATIHVLGGTGAVSDDVVAELKGMACVGKVERISGDGRVETGMEIYKAGMGSWGDTCVIANAWNYADALSIGAYCAANNAPIFGATGGTINEDQVAAIKAGGFTKIVIVGGSSAVDADAVKAALEASDDEVVVTEDDIAGDDAAFEYLVLAGDSRVETSAAIVDWACGKTVGAPFEAANKLDASSVCFSTAWNYADALAGINLAYNYNAPIMLVSDDDASKNAIEAIAGGMNRCWILGGTSSVSSTVEDWINQYM